MNKLGQNRASSSLDDSQSHSSVGTGHLQNNGKPQNRAMAEHLRHCLLYEFNLRHGCQEAHQNLCRAYGAKAPALAYCKQQFEQFAAEKSAIEVDKKPKDFAVKKEECEQNTSIKSEQSASSISSKDGRTKTKHTNKERWLLMTDAERECRMEQIRKANNRAIEAKERKKQIQQERIARMRVARAEKQRIKKMAKEAAAAAAHVQAEEVEKEKELEDEEKMENEEQQEEEIKQGNRRSVHVQTESTKELFSHWLRPSVKPKKQFEPETNSAKTKPNNKTTTKSAELQMKKRQLAMQLFEAESMDFDNCPNLNQLEFDKLEWHEKKAFFELAEQIMEKQQNLPSSNESNYLKMVLEAIQAHDHSATLYEIIGHVTMHGTMADFTPKKTVLDCTLNALNKLEAYQQQYSQNGHSSQMPSSSSRMDLKKVEVKEEGMEEDGFEYFR